MNGAVLSATFAKIHATSIFAGIRWSKLVDNKSTWSVKTNKLIVKMDNEKNLGYVTLLNEHILLNIISVTWVILLDSM